MKNIETIMRTRRQQKIMLAVSFLKPWKSTEPFMKAYFAARRAIKMKCPYRAGIALMVVQKEIAAAETKCFIGYIAPRICNSQHKHRYNRNIISNVKQAILIALMIVQIEK